MKHSIKKQMIVIFISLLAFMCVAVLVCNVWLLGPYYIRNKEAKFISMYEALLDAEQNDELDTSDEETYSELVRLAEKNNLFFLAVNLKDQKIITNVQHTMDLQQNLDAFMLNRTEKNDRTLKKTDEYELTETRGKEAGTEYLMMRGTLGSNYIFLIQSPIESVQQSVALSNRFLIVVELIVLVVGIWMVWFFSKRLTEPLRELAGLSEKMAELDFDTKYTSGGSNEIGQLGEHFNRMSENLEKAYSELLTANNELQKDIEKKQKIDDMRKEFLSNVSHELKTPIALIQGYAEGLAECINDDEESRNFYCEVIMDEAAKMNNMVKKLLTLNHLESGKDAIVFERFDLTKLVRTVVHSAELLADQKGAKILFEETESHYVWADEFKTEEVVTNFVSNAINHVDFDKVIEIKMKKENGKVHTSVFNTGVPIPEADIDKIWIKFYKVDKARTREYGGSGIGLSIVKAIMDSMHQKFGVKNYDNGVEFWFELEADNGREMKSEMTEEFAKPVEVKGEKTEQNEP